MPIPWTGREMERDKENLRLRYELKAAELRAQINHPATADAQKAKLVRELNSLDDEWNEESHALWQSYQKSPLLLMAIVIGILLVLALAAIGLEYVATGNVNSPDY